MASKIYYKIIFLIITTFITLSFSQKLFYKFGLIDKPNSRSSHYKPIALGGGIVLIPLIVIFSTLLDYYWDDYVLICLIILFLISVFDDIKNVSAKNRLLCHFLATSVFCYYSIVPLISKIFGNSEFIFFLSIFFIILSVSWFINAFNFMDGINGITSIQVIFICCSVLIFFF